MIQGGQIQQVIDQQQIIQCFILLNSSNMNTETRRSINQKLFDFEKSPIQLMIRLLSIFENNPDESLKLQSLVYFCNVAKRNWTIRRYNKTHSDFGNLKKQVKQKLLQYVCLKVKRYLPTLFDVIRFIVEKDYPHSYSTFSSFVLKMINEIDLNDISILIFKQLKEIFYEIGERKGAIAQKQFDENLREILNSLCSLTIKFKQEVINLAKVNSLSSNVIKLSKYIDQIILYILRSAPIEILDQTFSQELCKFLISKLQDLISTHSTSSKNIKVLLEKNIKSIVYDFGLLQISKPLFMSWILPDFFNTLVYIFQNSSSFIKNQTVRYSFIGLRRIIKQFTYYSEDNLYLSSIKSKKSSSNFMELRKLCNLFYRQTITENVVEQLLHYLLCNSFNKSLRSQSTFLDFEQGTTGIQRGKQKQISIENCVILLMQSILQRFPHQTHILITSLLMNSIKNDWKNLDNITIGNLLSAIAILPSTCKKNEVSRLQQIPILEVLKFIYTNPSFKIKFAGIVSGWIDAFSNEQLNSITGVLLDFIQNESGQDISQASLDLLMNCCQCLNKVVVQRTAAIDLRSLVQRVVPVALGIFQIIDNPQILWPMVTLISNTIVKVDFDTNLIINSIDPQKLMLLIKNQSTLLVEALCQMFKNFLCVIPRNMQASSVYRIVCYFLNNHLSQFSSVNHEKIFHLWYIAIREYSAVQGCQDLYVDLFVTHFRNNMYRKTSTLVFILEQYMLSSLIPDSIDNFIQLALQCYTEADDLQGEEREKLKIATLSFQITLISRYDLQKVNSNKLLNLIIMDLGNFDFQIITPTIRSSILSIINRYIIKHQGSFFNYLQSINLPLNGFFQAYFKSMEHLTSHTAIKINAIAVLQLMNSIDTNIVAPNFHYLVKIIIPSVETYNGTIQSGVMSMFIGKIDNSPSLRFASNTLSERKEEVRKRDTYQQINLASTFRQCISGFLSKCNISPQDAADSFNDPSWAARFLLLI